MLKSRKPTARWKTSFSTLVRGVTRDTTSAESWPILELHLPGYVKNLSRIEVLRTWSTFHSPDFDSQIFKGAGTLKVEYF